MTHIPFHCNVGESNEGKHRALRLKPESLIDALLIVVNPCDLRFVRTLLMILKQNRIDGNNIIPHFVNYPCRNIRYEYGRIYTIFRCNPDRWFTAVFLIEIRSVYDQYTIWIWRKYGHLRSTLSNHWGIRPLCTVISKRWARYKDRIYAALSPPPPQNGNRANTDAGNVKISAFISTVEIKLW